MLLYSPWEEVGISLGKSGRDWKTISLEGYQPQLPWEVVSKVPVPLFLTRLHGLGSRPRSFARSCELARRCVPSRACSRIELEDSSLTMMRAPETSAGASIPRLAKCQSRWNRISW